VHKKAEREQANDLKKFRCDSVPAVCFYCFLFLFCFVCFFDFFAFSSRMMLLAILLICILCFQEFDAFGTPQVSFRMILEGKFLKSFEGWGVFACRNFKIFIAV
jgi:hypothetical protein